MLFFLFCLVCLGTGRSIGFGTAHIDISIGISIVIVIWDSASLANITSTSTSTGSIDSNHCSIRITRTAGYSGEFSIIVEYIQATTLMMS